MGFFKKNKGNPSNNTQDGMTPAMYVKEVNKLESEYKFKDVPYCEPPASGFRGNNPVFVECINKQIMKKDENLEKYKEQINKIKGYKVMTNADYKVMTNADNYKDKLQKLKNELKILDDPQKQPPTGGKRRTKRRSQRRTKRTNKRKKTKTRMKKRKTSKRKTNKRRRKR